MKKHSSLVYSTDSGRLCPGCEQPVTKCQCKATQLEIPPPGSTVKIKRETKGRKGKGVTLIEGLPLPLPEIEKLAKVLKAKCSSGGTVKAGVIEIQGDHRTLVQDYLKAEGFTAKLAGG